MKEFFLKGKRYPSLQKFGQDMLMKLRRSDMSDKNLWDEIFGKRLPSQYLEIHSQPKEVVETVKSLENTNRDRRDGLISYYHMAYLLTGKTELLIEEVTFSTVEKLAAHMNELLADSTETFENFCCKLIDENNGLSKEEERRRREEEARQTRIKQADAVLDKAFANFQIFQAMEEKPP